MKEFKIDREVYVMFKKRAAVFYRGLKPRSVAEFFKTPIKHVLRVFERLTSSRVIFIELCRRVMSYVARVNSNSTT